MGAALRPGPRHHRAAGARQAGCGHRGVSDRCRSTRRRTLGHQRVRGRGRGHGDTHSRSGQPGGQYSARPMGGRHLRQSHSCHCPAGRGRDSRCRGGDHRRRCHRRQTTPGGLPDGREADRVEPSTNGCLRRCGQRGDRSAGSWRQRGHRSRGTGAADRRRCRGQKSRRDQLDRQRSVHRQARLLRAPGDPAS